MVQLAVHQCPREHPDRREDQAGACREHQDATPLSLGAAHHSSDRRRPGCRGLRVAARCHWVELGPLPRTGEALAVQVQ
eukprot:48595-Heterocapsa_arctica.AAC.1